MEGCYGQTGSGQERKNRVGEAYEVRETQAAGKYKEIDSLAGEEYEETGTRAGGEYEKTETRAGGEYEKTETRVTEEYEETENRVTGEYEETGIPATGEYKEIKTLAAGESKETETRMAGKGEKRGSRRTEENKENPDRLVGKYAENESGSIEELLQMVSRKSEENQRRNGRVPTEACGETSRVKPVNSEKRISRKNKGRKKLGNPRIEESKETKNLRQEEDEKAGRSKAVCCREGKNQETEEFKKPEIRAAEGLWKHENTATVKEEEGSCRAAGACRKKERRLAENGNRAERTIGCRKMPGGDTEEEKRTEEGSVERAHRPESYAKTILYIYPRLERIAADYGDHIRHRAILSYENRTAERAAEYLAEEILKKRAIEALKERVDAALKKLNDKERFLLEVRYFGRKKKLREFLEAGTERPGSERSYYRKQERLLKKVISVFSGVGLTEEAFFREYRGFGWMMSACRQIGSGRECAAVRRERQTLTELGALPPLLPFDGPIAASGSGRESLQISG